MHSNGGHQREDNLALVSASLISTAFITAEGISSFLAISGCSLEPPVDVVIVVVVVAFFAPDAGFGFAPVKIFGTERVAVGFVAGFVVGFAAVTVALGGIIP